MKTFNAGGVLAHAALKAGMDRKTARRYLRRGDGPGAARPPRDWRTHEDAFAPIWPEVVRWLEATPEIEAKALFEHLLAQRPDVVPADGLRTFQRRVQRWRAQYGPPKEVFFPQAREPSAIKGVKLCTLQSDRHRARSEQGFADILQPGG